MRMRFIKRGERKRLMVRGPVSQDSMSVWLNMEALGYEAVGLLPFLAHIILPGRVKKAVKK